MELSDLATEVLERAGWFSGRNINQRVIAWGKELGDCGFTMFPIAEAVLSEFGGLEIKQYPDLVQSGLLPISLDLDNIIHTGPAACAILRENFELFEEHLGMLLFPLGDTPYGYTIAISEDGRVFAVLDDMQMLGTNFGDALSNIVTGQRTHDFDCWIVDDKVVSNQKSS